MEQPVIAVSHLESELKQKLDKFDKLMNHARRIGTMNSPAICWAWVKIWEARDDDLELSRLFAGIVAWGSSDLYDEYREMVKVTNQA